MRVLRHAFAGCLVGRGPSENGGVSELYFGGGIHTCRTPRYTRVLFTPGKSTGSPGHGDDFHADIDANGG